MDTDNEPKKYVVVISACMCCGEHLGHTTEITRGVCVRCGAIAQWLIEDSRTAK